MSYPDVVIACIEHKVFLEVSRAIECCCENDNNMKDYSGEVDLIITANHSNYLVFQTEPNSLSLSESGKTATQLLQCPLLSEFTISSPCSEGRTRDVHSSLLIDVYVFLTLVSDGRLHDPG